MRAYESKEEDSLFKDPLAEVLSGKRGMEDAKLTLKVKTLAALQLCSGHVGGHWHECICSNVEELLLCSGDR